MSHRRRSNATAIFAVFALGVALVGCSPSGVAQPTPSVATTSDPIDLAVSAAKQSFLTYMDVLGRVVPADQRTIDAFLATSTGEQRQVDEDLYSQFHEEKWTLEGTAKVTLIELAPQAPTENEVTLVACIDVSDRKLFDETGKERFPPSTGTEPVTVKVVTVSDGSWLVAALTPRTGDPEC